MHLPENIRLVRKTWRESMEVFSERFGVSRFSCSKYENGENEPSASFLAKLCELTGLSALDLVNVELKDGDVPELPLKMNELLDVVNDGGGVVYGENKTETVVVDVNVLLSGMFALEKRVSEQAERIVALENKVLGLERPF